MINRRLLLASTMLLMVGLGSLAKAEPYCVLDHPARFMDGRSFTDIRVLVLFSPGVEHKTVDLQNQLATTMLAGNARRGNLLVITDVGEDDMLATASSSGHQDVVIVVDDIYMLDGKPKYNDLLSVYRDTEIAADSVVIVDGVPRTTRDNTEVVLMKGSISAQLMAHLIESAALLAYAKEPQRVIEYTSNLLAIQSEAHVATVIETKRPLIFEGCSGKN